MTVPEPIPTCEARLGLSIRVLTLNLHKGFAAFNRRFVLPQLRQAVREHHADIVFLQEVLGEHAGYAARHQDWPGVPQYEFLADTIWQDYAYGRNAVYPHGHHGNALLSKFPIVHSQNHDISIDNLEKRGMLHCVLTLPGLDTEVHTICVHLGLRGGHRRRQLELMCELIATQVPPSAPLVVAGDFNDWTLRAHDRLARCAGLHEAFVGLRGKAARTFPAFWPLLRLDRVYVRNADVAGGVVLGSPPWSRLSDHAALGVELSL